MLIGRKLREERSSLTHILQMKKTEPHKGRLVSPQELTTSLFGKFLT